MAIDPRDPKTGWEAIKQLLQPPAKLILDTETKPATLGEQPGSPKTGLTFKFLGGGSNKLVFRVSYQAVEVPWVFCVPGNPSLIKKGTAKKDAEYEVNTMQFIGENNVLVPRPFPLIPFPVAPNEASNVVVFEVSIGGEEDLMRPCFAEGHFDIGGRYLEMAKKKVNPGDQPQLHWMKNVVLKLPHATDKAILDRTIKTLNDIVRVYAMKPWEDFQVLYDQDDGSLLVFDPAKLGNLVEAKKNVDAWTAEWQRDLAAARKP